MGSSVTGRDVLSGDAKLAFVDNPPSNVLGPGISEEALKTAILKSGYPLQTVASNTLAKLGFESQQEWSYLDQDSGDIRTIDILARKTLFDWEQVEKIRVRPQLDIVAECKKSDLPYVFFLLPQTVGLVYFPTFAGLFNNESIDIKSDDDPSTWVTPISDILGLRDLPFIREPRQCATFTKSHHKGNEIEFIGPEAFQGLILPLVKAVHHFQKSNAPPRTAAFFDCHLVLGIGILDSPMAGVHVAEKTPRVELLPWFRIVRHETERLQRAYHGRLTRESWVGLDLVHKDFLTTYIANYVMPFANHFAKFVAKHADVLASGKGFVAGMKKDPFRNVHHRVMKRKII